MPVTLDTSNQETTNLFEYCPPLAGRRILEVGCGDGRLTWQLARQAGEVVGIDPSEEKITLARANLPEDLKGKTEIHALGLEDFYSRNPKPDKFDLVLLSWSL